VTFISGAGAAVPFLFGALLAGSVASFLLTPLVRRIAIRYGAIDHPDARRVNVRPVPRGGGVAVAMSFVGVTLGFLAVNAVVHGVTIPANVQLDDLLGLLLGGALATAFGVVDDAFDLRARWQFAGQLGLAAFAIEAPKLAQRHLDRADVENDIVSIRAVTAGIGRL
jgi:UDP-GlcNAc:undecaprenyl-phosphate GlcNAc-1-phosphate transferase